MRAAQIIRDEKIAQPILLGSKSLITEKIRSLCLDLDSVEIINPSKSSCLPQYTEDYYQLRSRKGITRFDAERVMKTHNTYGMMMLRNGEADGLVSGLTQHFPDTIRPALQIIRPLNGIRTITGVYMMIFKNQTYFIADPVINIDPSDVELAEIAILAAETAASFDIEPRVAMLSFSSFGSTKHPFTEKVRRAMEIVRLKAPWIPIEGELQGDIAVVPELLDKLYPFHQLGGAANVLVFPDLTSANLAYKLLAKLGGAVAIGPILKGMSKPVYLLQNSSDVNDIVNMTALAVMDVQERSSEIHNTHDPVGRAGNSEVPPRGGCHKASTIFSTNGF